MEELKGFIQAIGSMAEMAGLMLTQLMKNGFERKEAVAICKDYFITLATQKPEKEVD